jgi:hypothetical protein
MMPRPPEITEEEWEALTSPENYFMDGEVSQQEADRLFIQRVEELIRQRRQRPG